MSFIQKINSLYQDKYKYSTFYERLLYLNSKEEDLFRNNNFLSSYVSADISTNDKEPIVCIAGKIRVDLPIWFGKENAKNRIMILGSEPRDTNCKYNIEHQGKYVFGTPFAIEDWPKNKYFKAFEPIVTSPDTFVYFNDVVKEYYVGNDGKTNDDRTARKLFWERAQDHRNFLEKEIDIIEPNYIIALGNVVNDFFQKSLSKYCNKVIKVRHPSRGGSKVARQSIEKLVSTI